MPFKAFVPYCRCPRCAKSKAKTPPKVDGQFLSRWPNCTCGKCKHIYRDDWYHLEPDQASKCPACGRSAKPKPGPAKPSDEDDGIGAHPKQKLASDAI